MLTVGVKALEINVLIATGVEQMQLRVQRGSLNLEYQIRAHPPERLFGAQNALARL